jgi:hypothetical protein
MSIGSTARDRTTRAVATQLAAMGCTRFEVGILDAAPGKMLIRIWTAAEIEHGMPWLRRENALGHDVYVRPAGSVGLILVDDLDPTASLHLHSDGLGPAVVLETSPRNCQAWVRVSQQPIAPEQATMAARILAERYGGDPASADWRHFGRLAGFTNRKPKHRQEGGMQPFVLLREATGRTAQRGPDLLAEATARLEAMAATQAAVRPVPATVPAPGELHPPGAAYAAVAGRIMARYPQVDLSRLDWMVCRDLASASLAVDVNYLEQALREGSPNLAQRKAGHIDDYVARTAAKVMRDAKVLGARAGLT